MEHPTVSKIRQHGYPEKEEIYGTDLLNNTVFEGDEILVLDDAYFLVHALDQMTINVLEHLGATHHIASK